MKAIMSAVAKPAAALFLTLLMAATAAHSSHAYAQSNKAYKWVDGQGVTHFSARPPEDGKPSETINIRTGEAARDTEPAELPTQPETQADSPPATEPYRQPDRRLCDQAREAAAALDDSDRVQVREQDGEEYRMLDEEELEEWRERARENIRRHCE